MRRKISFLVLSLCFLMAALSIYEMIGSAGFLSNREVKIPVNPPTEKNTVEENQVTLPENKISVAKSYNAQRSVIQGVNKNNSKKKIKIRKSFK